MTTDTIPTLAHAVRIGSDLSLYRERERAELVITHAHGGVLVELVDRQEYVFGTRMLDREQIDGLDAAHELIAQQLDIPSISAHALQQWSEAVITASLMARMTGTGDDEMAPICDHLQQLINCRKPDGSLMLTDADRQQIADAVDVMSAVATVTPREIAVQCAISSQVAMESGRLPEMLRGGCR